MDTFICVRDGCDGVAIDYPYCSPLCDVIDTEFRKLGAQLSRTTSPKRRRLINEDWAALAAYADTASEYTNRYSRRRARELDRSSRGQKERKIENERTTE